MDDKLDHRYRNSSIAAALDALAPGVGQDAAPPEDPLPLLTADDTMAWLVGDEEREPDRSILNACRDLAMVGIRPRTRAIAAYLKDRSGTAPPRDVITPILKRWRAAQWKSEAVRAAFQAYAALDAEQRLAFRLRAEVDDATLCANPGDGSGDSMPFELRVHYRGGRVLTDHADRATTAWVKLRNLVDRHSPDVTRVELSERTPEGMKLLKHWSAGGSSIATW